MIVVSGAVAQQSLFNVPSSQITSKGRNFLQVQQNLGAIEQTNITYDRGFAHSVEIGVNVFNVDLSNRAHGLRLMPPPIRSTDLPDPLLMVNAQKSFRIARYYSLAFGVQYGDGRFKGNIDGKSLNRFVTVSKSLPHDGLIVIGA